MTLSDQAAIALKGAVATSGKNKGMLKATCPPSNTLAAAAWQGAMMVCNPYKVGIATQMFFTQEQREVYNEVLNMFEAMPKAWIVSMQRDRKTLESLGVW